MPAAMTGQKGNTYALQRAHGDDVAGLAEGCVNIHLADGGHSLDLVQPRPPDDGDGGGWFSGHHDLLSTNIRVTQVRLEILEHQRIASVQQFQAICFRLFAEL